MQITIHQGKNDKWSIFTVIDQKATSVVDVSTIDMLKHLEVVLGVGPLYRLSKRGPYRSEDDLNDYCKRRLQAIRNATGIEDLCQIIDWIDADDTMSGHEVAFLLKAVAEHLREFE